MKNLTTGICRVLGLIWIGTLLSCATWRAPNVTLPGKLLLPTEQKKHSIDLLKKAIKQAQHRNTLTEWQLTLPVPTHRRDLTLYREQWKLEFQELELVPASSILDMEIPTVQRTRIEFGHTKTMTGGSTLINLNKDNEQKEKIQRN
jgi:hypothetical protein